MGALALGAGPATSNIYPLGQTAAFFAFDIHNVGITAAAAAHAILLGRVPVFPVVVLLEPLLLIQRRLLEEGLAGKLSAQGSIGRAMLDGGVPVSKISKVVNVARGQESAGGKRVNGRITPL